MLQENDAEVSDDTWVENNNIQESQSMQSKDGAVITSNKKSKKKKKKKTKVATSSSTSKGEKLFEEGLEILTLDAQHGQQKNQLENLRLREDFIKQCAPSILQVDPKCLNPENELRRIFGSKVVKSFEKGNQASSSRQLRGARRGSHHIKKTILVSPLEHWPRWDGSLSMEFLETKDGYHHFRSAVFFIALSCFVFLSCDSVSLVLAILCYMILTMRMGSVLTYVYST